MRQWEKKTQHHFFLSLSIFHAHSMHTFCIISSLISPKGIECRLCLYVYEYVVKWPCWHTSTKRNTFLPIFHTMLISLKSFSTVYFWIRNSYQNHLWNCEKIRSLSNKLCILWMCKSTKCTINVAEFHVAKKNQYSQFSRFHSHSE